MDDARMRTVGYAKSCDEGVYQRFLAMDLFAEQFHILSRSFFFLIICRDSVFPLAEFHFTKVDDSVGPLYDKVDLTAFGFFLSVGLVKPSGNLGCHSAYA